MKTKRPATFKGNLLDAVIDLRYMRRNVSYDMIRTEVTGNADEGSDDAKLLVQIGKQIDRSQEHGDAPETCLNRLMEVLG